MKLNVPVEVPLPKMRSEANSVVAVAYVAVRFEMVAVVAPKLSAKRRVDVTFVIVAFVEMSVGAVNVLTVADCAVSNVPLAFAKWNVPVEVPSAKTRFVMFPFVTNRLVFVAFVTV